MLPLQYGRTQIDDPQYVFTSIVPGQLSLKSGGQFWTKFETVAHVVHGAVQGIGAGGVSTGGTNKLHVQMLGSHVVEYDVFVIHPAV